MLLDRWTFCPGLTGALHYSGIEENMNKGNVECTGSPSVVRNLQSELSNSMDDIPIGRWREPAFVAQMGALRTLSQRSEHSAAKNLLGLSQPR